MVAQIKRAVWSLRGKVLLATLIPSGLALALGAIVAVQGYENVARELVQRRTAELAEVTSAWLGEYVESTGQTLQRVAAQDSIRSRDPDRLDAALSKEQSLAYLFNGGLAVYDVQGSLIWGRSRAEFRQAMSQLDLSALTDQVRRSRRPVYTDVIQMPSETGLFVATLAPIIQDGAVRAVLVGLVNLQTSTMGTTLANILEIEGGGSGFAYLVDGSGRVIYHRNVAQLGSDYADMPPVKHVMAGETDASVSEYAGGEMALSGYSPVPDTDWGVVTHQSWNAIVGPLQAYSNVLIGVLALGSLVVGAIVFMIVHRVLRPVQALKSGAERIAEGDFDHTIDVQTRDEMATLAERFNQMTAALATFYERMEHQVAERTRELRQSEERFRQLYEDAPLAYFSVDRSAVIRMANPRASELLGYARSDLIGSSVFDLYPDIPEGRAKARDCFAKLQREGELNGEEMQMERADGEIRWISLTVRPVQSPDGDVFEYRSMIVDITARKVAEARAERAAALEERARLARELHDSATQSVYSVTLMGEAARRLAKQGEADRSAAYLDKLNRSSQQALKEMRLIVHELRPKSSLAELGLIESLRNRLNAVEERAGVETSLQADGDVPLSLEAQIELYHVAREALNNALKHAEATAVAVELIRHNGEVWLTVADDGCGFEVESVALNGQGGMGLTNMAERMAHSDGHIAINSTLGAGTKIVARLPVEGMDA